MAKKKKTQKSGMKKRQQAKQNKRVRVKKATKPVAQKKMSMGKLKKSLALVPKIVFEPEIAQCSYDKDALQKAQESEDKLPDQIHAACTDELTACVINGLKELEVRAMSERNEVLGINAKAMVYYMETEKSPAFMNQITVGLYLRDAFEITGTGEAITEENVIEKVQAYEEEWIDYMQEKAESLHAAEIPATPLVEDEDDDIIDVSPFEEFREKMGEYLQKAGKLDEDAIERVDEDMEAFLDDFLVEEGLNKIGELKPAHLTTFLGEWFIENMNPTKDDLENMILSVDACMEYGKSTGEIDGLDWNMLKMVLDGKDQFLSKL